MDYTGKALKGLYEVIGLLKDIRKQNGTIIKQLKEIDTTVCDVHGYSKNVVNYGEYCKKILGVDLEDGGND